LDPPKGYFPITSPQSLACNTTDVVNPVQLSHAVDDTACRTMFTALDGHYLKQIVTISYRLTSRNSQIICSITRFHCNSWAPCYDFNEAQLIHLYTTLLFHMDT